MNAFLDTCPNGAVCLVGTGSNQAAGYGCVEMCYNNTWGTVHVYMYVEVAGAIMLPQWCADSLASQVSRVTTPTSCDPTHQYSDAV